MIGTAGCGVCIAMVIRYMKISRRTGGIFNEIFLFSERNVFYENGNAGREIHPDVFSSDV